MRNCLALVAFLGVLGLSGPAHAERTVSPTDLLDGGSLQVATGLSNTLAYVSGTFGGASLDGEVNMLDGLVGARLWVLDGVALKVEQPFVLSSTSEVSSGGATNKKDNPTGRDDLTLGFLVGGMVTPSLKLVAQFELTPDSGSDGVGDARTDLQGTLIAATPIRKDLELFLGCGFTQAGEDDGGDNEGEQLIGLAGVNYRKGRLSVVPNGLISYTTEGEGTSQQEAFTTLGFETTVGFEILPDLTVTGSGLVAHVFEHEVMPGLDTSANGFGFSFGLTYAAAVR
jgi:hypothetical protein